MFFFDLLVGFEKIKEKDDRVEDKFYLESDFSIKTLRERGKF